MITWVYALVNRFCKKVWKKVFGVDGYGIMGVEGARWDVL